MGASAIARLGVRALSAAYADGRLSPRDAIEAYADRIARYDSRLGCYLHLRPEDARREAERSGERWRAGAPLSAIDGTPFAVKANIGVAGLPLHAGIGAYRANIAQQDAGAVARLKQAGAIPLGLLNMHEGALGATTDNPHFGRTHNPWKEGLTPGGSSGGSAAAVAAGLCAFALGTDTMGSVRIPSAYCGVAGVKPSKGVVPSEGLLDLSPTLDHVGVHAACAADLAAILNVFSIQTSRVGGPTVAMARWGTGVAVEPDIEAAFDAAEGMLRTMAEIVPVDVSGFDFAALRRKGLLISEVEGHRVHEEKLKTARSGFSNAFADLLEWGARQPEERIERAYADVRAAAARFAGLFDGVDAIALPTAPQGPFPFEANVPANQADLTCIANFGGFPAVAVPASAEGAPPASIQFIGRPGADGLVLGLAAAFEEARGTAPRPVRFLAP